LNVANATQQLRPLGDAELVIGQPLRGDLCDSDGRVLVPRGRVLTQETLDQLGPRAIVGLFGGPEWRSGAEARHNPADSPRSSRTTPATSAVAVVDELLRHRDQAEPTADKRRSTRHQWVVPLTLNLQESSTYGQIERTIHVTAVDISRSGFAFLYRQYVAPGAQIVARFDTLPTQPQVVGIVRNCCVLDGAQHRIGVQFIKAERSSDSPTEDAAADNASRPPGSGNGSQAR